MKSFNLTKLDKETVKIEFKTFCLVIGKRDVDKKFWNKIEKGLKVSPRKRTIHFPNEKLFLKWLLRGLK